MSNSNDGLRRVLQVVQESLNQKELDAVGPATLQDLHTTIARIQARQDAERTMMDMNRLQILIGKISEVEDLVRASGDIATDYFAFVWGSLSAVLLATSQDRKALDILLDAYERLANVIPSLKEFISLFRVHPNLWTLLEAVLLAVLHFQDTARRLSSHPNMRNAFRSMWNDYKPRFEAKLRNLESRQLLMAQIAQLSSTPASATSQVAMNIQLVAGNIYGNIEVNDANAHIGDSHFTSENRDINIDQLLASVSDIERSREKDLLSREKAAHEMRYDKVTEWIAGSSPDKHQDRACDLKCSDTGQWILHHDLVTAWMRDDLPGNSILWIHGMPGAGKTILASVLIAACQEIEDAKTAFFYCTHDDQETHTMIAILKGLLMQAIAWRPELLAYLDDQRRQGGETTVRREHTAKRLMNLLFQDSGQLYLVIDGIDECSLDDRKSILLFLRQLVEKVDQKDPGRLRLLVISQNEPDIRKHLITADVLQIDKTLNGNDIKLFASRHAQKIGSKFDLRPDEVVALQDRTCWQAAGQFLYAKLVLENLDAQITLQHFREEMKESAFPAGLSDAYTRIIKRIRDNSTVKEWTLIQQLLGWMTCAARPLKWHEMQGALSINFGELAVNFEECAPRRHVHELCGALVSVHDDRISLVHMTAREFIKSSEYIDHPLTECELADLCIRYLSLPCFDVGLEPEDLRYYVWEGAFAFVDYAAAKWMHHLHKVADQAQHLLDPIRWVDREEPLNNLWMTTREFSERLAAELYTSRIDAETRGVNMEMSSSIIALLERSSINDAQVSFQRLWTHDEASRTGNTPARQDITLENLRMVVEEVRLCLEQEFQYVRMDQANRDKLIRYYGDRVYRCSKPSCYFFHQGFKDASARNSHVARHERPFGCPEPDCPSAEFGFGDKKGLRAHVLEFHPDSEMKAMMFSTNETDVKHVNTRFRCEKCNKSFVRKAILEAHERSHAGQRPYDCPKCDKSFARKWDCTRHERNHESRARV